MSAINNSNLIREGVYTEKRSSYKDEYMDTKLHEIVFDDFRIFLANHELKKKKVYHPVIKFPPIQMHFLLRGEHRLKSQSTNFVSTFSKNQHNLIYLPHHNMDFTYESNTAQLLGIQLTENFFYRLVDENSKSLSLFWENVLRKKEAQLLPKYNMDITSKIKSNLLDIINTNRKGYLKRLFIEAKIIELFLYQLEQFDNPETQKIPSIKKDDIEKLYFVKNLIEENILSDFSLIGFAHEAGLNDFKLKKGFKELFGTTVFNYINDLKMDYSKQLILDEKKSISETAYILGYSEPQHFSAAFKKTFGYSPGKLK